ncbi:MAG: hypothetical protein MPJ50_10590 [Pirellulales bacterium]|nr:hypothetical protein [Pirellulales bacterium]
MTNDKFARTPEKWRAGNAAAIQSRVCEVTGTADEQDRNRGSSRLPSNTSATSEFVNAGDGTSTSKAF